MVCLHTIKSVPQAWPLCERSKKDKCNWRKIKKNANNIMRGCKCLTRKRNGYCFFFLTCREGKWKWALYRIKASEDDPLAMKFDDPRSPSDTQPSLTLPWAPNTGACSVKRTPQCVLINGFHPLFVMKGRQVNYSPSLYIAYRILFKCVDSIWGRKSCKSCLGIF